ncbi:PWWP domain-containing DNA repair factor 3A-like [Erpetoichthys calabaricus]|uniref:PWWP domain-containing DNA repair factor 3A-like n=1 Tax=Erpetoichthys calabaricus TaxID=27687 RepID=UPI0022348BAB|nr:PWWP domain-containing DNA repair factor 3A-like [Erpetoichthys calabaricus]
MTYIEDEELIDGLYNFLDEVLSRAVGTFERIDRVGIILDVLMPEALIKAVQTVERISLPEAENLFMDGPADSEWYVMWKINSPFFFFSAPLFC